MIRSEEERFWEKVDASDPDGCWLWTASVNIVSGYPQFHWRGRNGYARPFSYTRYVDDIPKGCFVGDTCGNKLCIRPDHLFSGTMREITLKPISRSISNICHRRPTCEKGHDLSGDNLRLYFPPGSKFPFRVCVTCDLVKTIRSNHNAWQKPDKKRKQLRWYGYMKVLRDLRSRGLCAFNISGAGGVGARYCKGKCVVVTDGVPLCSRHEFSGLAESNPIRRNDYGSLRPASEWLHDNQPDWNTRFRAPIIAAAGKALL